MADFSDILSNLPLLRQLSDDDRRQVIASGHEKRLAKGEILFHEGDEVVGLFAVVDGRIKMVRYSLAGKELLLHLVAPGATFADAALVGRGGYPATAEAVEPSTVWCLPKAKLVEMIRGSPELGLAMIGSISAWTRTLAGKLEMLTQRRVEERLALFLMGRVGRRELEPGVVVELGQPKQLVAAECGTGPEVLSRTFKRLEADGIIETGTTTVKVLDPERLAALAEWLGNE
ncbi:MAG: Crp/Fnr family transcriptional regulator [Thermoanaerobaculales bacterium]|jgi:CRP/FNR family transcriptional regulator|nr:Crp/Fnr family transcriptional regulator [Thermoanaerobaculales bacterium]